LSSRLSASFAPPVRGHEAHAFFEIAGVRGAIAGLMAEVVEDHVYTHLVDAEKRPGALSVLTSRAGFTPSRGSAKRRRDQALAFRSGADRIPEIDGVPEGDGGDREVRTRMARFYPIFFWVL
jgi:hypothetical protein